MADALYNIDTSPNGIYVQYSVPQPPFVPPVLPVDGAASPVTTINGNAGAGAVGPTITFSGGSTGYEFTTAASTVSLAVSNAATVRTSISAAQSGANADINTFSALTGNTGFNAWTGTPDQASHATYSGTASVGYVASELQGVMDSLQQTTGLVMALLTALLASGVIET